MHLDVSELRGLEHDLEKGASRIEPLASKAVGKTAFDTEADAKTFAPVDTGNLRNSISTSVDGLSAEVKADTEYSDYVEYGTSKMSAQPYMGPAFERNAPKLEQALGQIGSKIL